jgi:non-ribosomal peptide synthetase component E (peptide arylation enzyme)
MFLAALFAGAGAVKRPARQVCAVCAVGRLSAGAKVKARIRPREARGLMLVGRNAVQTLGAMLESTARWFPNKPLIIFQGKAITYDDFNKSAARLASVLSGLGVGPGVPVGIYLRSRPELAVAYHACQKIGAIAVPISASYKPNELEGLGRRTGMPALSARRILSLQSMRFVANCQS